MLKEYIKNFYPGSFALVMSTGILSIASRLFQLELISKILFLLNNCFFIVLLIVFFIHLTAYFPSFKQQLSTPSKAPGFLTIVAGSCILANEYVLQEQYKAATFLWVFSILCWLVLVYSFVALSVLKRVKAPLEKALDGSWLLLVVSTQAIVITGAFIAEHLAIPTNVTSFILFCGWLLGVFLYFVIATIIFFRLVFSPVHPAEITPAYWIDTGAAAISVVAGAALLPLFNSLPGVNEFIPLVKSFVTMLWCIASWWIPLLVILESWRHIKSGFTYSPAYWSLVFPLGMYTVASSRMEEQWGFNFLHSIAGLFLVLSYVVWLIVFIGMLIGMLKIFAAKKQAQFINL